MAETGMQEVLFTLCNDTLVYGLDAGRTTLFVRNLGPGEALVRLEALETRTSSSIDILGLKKPWRVLGQGEEVPFFCPQDVPRLFPDSLPKSGEEYSFARTVAETGSLNLLIRTAGAPVEKKSFTLELVDQTEARLIFGRKKLGA